MWTFGRVLLVALAWIVLVPLATIVWFLVASAGAGAGGIGAVSIGFPVVVLFVWLVPPLLMVVVWSVAKFVS